jgi:hypothetical protein
MQTNTENTPDQNEVASHPSSGSTLFMLIREDLDYSKRAAFRSEFDMSIDFISAESEDDVLAYQEDILESEGFEIHSIGATNGNVDSFYIAYTMNKADFWEVIEDHFEECIDDLVHWAAHNGIEAAALLDAADRGQTPGHLALAQHARFRSVVEEFVLRSTAKAQKTERSRGRKSL